MLLLLLVRKVAVRDRFAFEERLSASVLLGLDLLMVGKVLELEEHG